MPRSVIEARSKRYTVSEDDFATEVNFPRGLVRMRLIDELTGKPPGSAITLECDADVTTRVSRDGIVGLAGIPVHLFPNLSAQAYSIDVSIAVQGYVPLTVTVDFPVDPQFPARFSMVNNGDIRLHRLPVTIRGRTVASGSGVPASVRITGLWRTLPPPDLDPPAEAPNIVSVFPGCYAARPSATARVRRRELVAVAGEDKVLLDGILAGAGSLRLSDRINLSVGDFLQLGDVDPWRIEYVEIAAIDGFTTADQPATVTLALSTALPHDRPAVVRKVIPQAPGADNNVSRDGAPGDRSVFLASMSDLAGAAVVELYEPGVSAEFHRVELFSTVADGDGFFRLPALSRVAQIEIEADHGADTRSRVFSPDYAVEENVLDFHL